MAIRDAETSYQVKDKPFWIISEKEHKERDRTSKGDCCFNHIIGLPRKDGIEKPRDNSIQTFTPSFSAN
jgi:hypothetical protein